MPERFSRLVIMNTWLHHAEYEYSPGIQNWITQNLPGGIFRDNIPEKFNWGTLMAMSTGRVTPQESLLVELNGGTPTYSPEAAAVKYGYDAPFAGLGDEGVTGPRRFPLSIPVHDAIAGNAVEQEKHFAAVNSTTLPVHFIWGDSDNVFTLDWGKKWHSLIPHSTLDVMEGAAHFLQDSHGPQIVEKFVELLGAE
jgi:haloalkane dehalogenase